MHLAGEGEDLLLLLEPEQGAQARVDRGALGGQAGGGHHALDQGLVDLHVRAHGGLLGVMF